MGWGWGGWGLCVIVSVWVCMCVRMGACVCDIVEGVFVSSHGGDTPLEGPRDQFIYIQQEELRPGGRDETQTERLQRARWREADTRETVLSHRGFIV